MKRPGFLLSRAERRAHAKAMAKFPATLEKIEPSEWPQDGVRNRTSVWRSRNYLVQAFREEYGLIRLSICRTTVNSEGHWEDNLSWDELQSIKDDIGYKAWDAVEVYPAKADIVNVANMRHLWVMPQLLPYAWRSEKPVKNLADETGNNSA